MSADFIRVEVVVDAVAEIEVEIEVEVEAEAEAEIAADFLTGTLAFAARSSWGLAVAVAAAVTVAMAFTVALVEEMTIKGRLEMESELKPFDGPSSSDPESVLARAICRLSPLFALLIAVTSAKMDEDGECQYLPEVEGVGRLKVAEGAVECIWYPADIIARSVPMGYRVSSTLLLSTTLSVSLPTSSAVIVF